MPTDQELIQELHNQLTSSQFEIFLDSLLKSMGFDEIEVTGTSGDRGIDLKATWTQAEVPGLEVDLNFKIQAKRVSPSSTINPRYVRELRGSLVSGEYGLLITTARATENTRSEGLSDISRIVSVIDGQKLIELCKKYEIGVGYTIDLSEIVQPQVTTAPVTPVETAGSINPIEILDRSLSENFKRLGNTPIYRGSKKRLLVRVSKYYDRSDRQYWYGLKNKDIERVDQYDLTHFAYICANAGVVLIPVEKMKGEIKNLNASFREGSLVHYHIYFRKEGNSILWVKSGGSIENVDKLFHQHK